MLKSVRVRACVRGCESNSMTITHCLRQDFFGKNLEFFSETAKEIGEQEVHIHHTSGSRKFDRSAFKSWGGAESSTFQFHPADGNFVVSKCAVPY